MTSPLVRYLTAVIVAWAFFIFASATVFYFQTGGSADLGKAFSGIWKVADTVPPASKVAVGAWIALVSIAHAIQRSRGNRFGEYLVDITVMGIPLLFVGPSRLLEYYPEALVSSLPHNWWLPHIFVTLGTTFIFTMTVRGR